jgi:UDP-glucuronate 4-epimerase
LSKSILITGVAGFLGSHLAEKLLDNGHRITGIDNFDPFYAESIKRDNLRKCLSNSSFKLVELDICHTEKLFDLQGDWEIVLHVAAKAGVLPSVKKPQDYVSVNVQGTLNVLEFMRLRGIKKYIFASSSSIYGNSPIIPFTEDQKVEEPISPYAFSKRSCELMNFTYHKLYGIDCLNLRLFTLYGPRQRPDLSIYKFTKLIENDEPVQMYGDGSTARDYTHVHDVVNGFLLGMEYLAHHDNVYEIVNIGNTNPVQLLDLISKLYKILDKPLNIKQLPKQTGDVEMTCASIEKAQKLLGYTPTVPFEEGLKSFWEWYKEKNMQHLPV